MKAAALIALTLMLPGTAVCSQFLSYTGQLASPEDVFAVPFSLSSTADIVIQTWGFGGGINAAGLTIQAGGFDPMVALFVGAGPSATIVTVAGNPAADADTLSNPPLSFIGNCPSAGMVVIGTGAGNSVCGDDRLQLSGLAAGNYTLVLTDANYFPSAVNPGPPTSILLSDGFSDLTGGVVQTCNTTSDGTTCITPSGNFAVDIVSLSGAGLNTPEPQSFTLLMTGLGLAGLLKRRLKRGHSK